MVSRLVEVLSGRRHALRQIGLGSGDNAGAIAGTLRNAQFGAAVGFDVLRCDSYQGLAGGIRQSLGDLGVP